MTEAEARALLELMLREAAEAPEIDRTAIVEAYLAIREGRNPRERSQLSSLLDR